MMTTLNAKDNRWRFCKVRNRKFLQFVESIAIKSQVIIFTNLVKNVLDLNPDFSQGIWTIILYQTNTKNFYLIFFC